MAGTPAKTTLFAGRMGLADGLDSAKIAGPLGPQANFRQ
jgi:hypothetical protein